jgi:hypothetical protein
VQSPCQLHLGHPREPQPGRLMFGVAAAVLPWVPSMMGSVESVACHRHGTGAAGSVLVFHKKTVLVEESPMASVPPLGSAGSTGPQGPPGRGYEIYPTWLPAAGCRPGSGRSPGTRWPAGAARAAGAEPRGRCPAGALVGSGRGYQRLAQTDHVIIAGVRVARAAGPRCGPGPPGRRPGPLPSRPGGAGGSSTQRRGQVHVAVSPVLDPLAELQRGHGRFLCWSARAKARPA